MKSAKCKIRKTEKSFVRHFALCTPHFALCTELTETKKDAVSPIPKPQTPNPQPLTCDPAETFLLALTSEFTRGRI